MEEVGVVVGLVGGSLEGAQSCGGGNLELSCGKFCRCWCCCCR
jgi:hypothetical protein